MTDTPVEPDEVEDDDDSEDEDDESEDEGPATPTGRNYVDLPDGHLTLVGFSHLLEKPKSQGGRNVKVSSQVLYSTAKNTKAFPNKTHTDGRQIVDTEEALAWWDDKEARKAERASAATAPAGEETAAEATA